MQLETFTDYMLLVMSITLLIMPMVMAFLVDAEEASKH